MLTNSTNSVLSQIGYQYQIPLHRAEAGCTKRFLQSLLPTCLSWSGIALLLFVPYHLALRLVTDSRIVFAWKEVAEGIGTLAFVVLSQRFRPSWRLLSLYLIVLTCSLAFAFDFDDPQLSLEGYFLIFGFISVGYLFYRIGQSWSQGRNTPLIALVVGISLIAAFWLYFEGRLGLSYLFKQEQEGNFYLAREGINRARFTFDSPMDAGQWMWLCSTLSLAFFFLSRRALQMALFFVVFILDAIAILFTGSRGPYLLLAGSIPLLLIGMCRLSLPKKKTKLIVLGAVLLLLVVGLAIYRPLDEEANAFSNIFGSVSDLAEQDNVLRLDLMREGVARLADVPLVGEGMNRLSNKNPLTAIDYENTYLGLAVATGLPGIVMGLTFFSLIALVTLRSSVALLKRRGTFLDVVFVALAPVWLAYSFVFPHFQGRIASLINWVVIGLALAALEQRRLRIQPSSKVKVLDR